MLIDADEAFTPELASEINAALRNHEYDGYFIELQMHFLGRRWKILWVLPDCRCNWLLRERGDDYEGKQEEEKAESKLPVLGKTRFAVYPRGNSCLELELGPCDR